jgi:O-methyltransferase involved in polyketide biosynthesis
MSDFDPSVPNPARMFGYTLGNKTNFAADREAVEAIVRESPDAGRVALVNRLFLRRAVRYVVGQGITQIIDIGSGLPTFENTHETAQATGNLVRVAYVDNDPVVVGHVTALLADRQRVIAVGGDLRSPELILGAPAIGAFYDLASPVAVVMSNVLHFLDDSAAYDAVAYIRHTVPQGSYIVISHATADEADPGETRHVKEIYDKAGSPLSLRTRAEIERFFDGLELVMPGVVDVNEWGNPHAEKLRTICYGGVARKL